MGRSGFDNHTHLLNRANDDIAAPRLKFADGDLRRLRNCAAEVEKDGRLEQNTATGHGDESFPHHEAVERNAFSIGRHFAPLERSRCSGQRAAINGQDGSGDLSGRTRCEECYRSRDILRLAVPAEWN